MSFQHALAFVLRWEGGWADHPHDPGGATMRGITLATYTQWRLQQGRKKPTKEDLRNISDEEVQAIYRAGYWGKCRCDELPAGLALLVFDMAVNAGPARAVRLLQATVGEVQDGIIGPRTVAAAATSYAAGPSALFAEYSARRAHYYGGLSTFRTFGLGWLRRAFAGQAEAMRLVTREALLIERGNDLAPTFKE